MSRTHPSLVRRLFALEVPEIASGVVEIVSLAREAGHRTKIAVRATEPGVNAKGACIGELGQRVRAVTAELGAEKIDIVDYSDDLATFVKSALSPAKVTDAFIIDPATKAVRALVPDYQLSLAIGKEGQNARLAAKLTGAQDRHPARFGDGGTDRLARHARSRRDPRGEGVEWNPSEPASAVAVALPALRFCGCVVRDGAVVADARAGLPGRGAWVHSTRDCVEAATARRAWSRAFRRTGTLDASGLLTHDRIRRIHERTG